MRNATDLLAQYADYHRDRRNIVSHFIGVPMIVFGVGVLLAARRAVPLGGLALTLGLDRLRPGGRLVPDPRQHRRSASPSASPSAC